MLIARISGVCELGGLHVVFAASGNTTRISHDFSVSVEKADYAFNKNDIIKAC